VDAEGVGPCLLPRSVDPGDMIQAYSRENSRWRSRSGPSLETAALSKSKSDILPFGRIETRGAVLIASELGFRSLGVQDAIFKASVWRRV